MRDSVWEASGAGTPCASYPRTHFDEPLPATILGGAAAPHLAPRRPPRSRGLRLRRLARRGGPVLLADAAARAAGPLRLAVQGEIGLRRLARAAGRADRPRLARRDERVPRQGS